MGDKKQRNGKQDRNQKRQAPQGETLASKPFKALRGFKVGPTCLACNQTIDLRRQSTGNGYLHSGCEPKRGQAPVLYVEQVGEDDLQLVKGPAASQVA